MVDKDKEIFCPHCGGGLEFLTEEDDMQICSRLYWCARCKIGFNIQTGPQVDEWATDCANQTGISYKTVINNRTLSEF